LYTPGTASNFNPTSSADAIHIPDPDTNVAESFSAWRNTDTQFISPGGPWHIILGLGPIEHFGPAAKVELQVQTQHVAVNFAQNDRVLEIAKANRAIYGKTPIYLIPEVRATLPTVELKHEITVVSKGRIEQHNLKFQEPCLQTPKPVIFTWCRSLPITPKPAGYLQKQ
jgi:hypothetical protein